MLRTSRVHPKVSVYHVLEGVHNFNQSSWAPPATRATIFVPPETRSSWGSQAINLWYVGPAPKHYRCYKFYVPATGKTRITGQATFYPEHCEVPTEHPMDAATRVVKYLLNAIRRLQKSNMQHNGRHSDALRTLATIFRTETGAIKPTTTTPQQT